MTPNNTTENTATVPVDHMEELASLFGNLDENIAVFAEELNVKAALREDGIMLSGTAENVATAHKALECVIGLSRKGEHIDR
ncbi:MAG: hypothetical protein FWD16_06385, partial [Clostridia bacterium]|nr:hypothetical protein [Clostridia bacterium]